MGELEQVTRLSKNVVITNHVTNNGMKEIEFVCSKYDTTFGYLYDYILFDNDESEIVTRVNLCKRDVGNLKLDDTIGHPAIMDINIANAVSKYCSKYSPHIVNVNDKIIVNNVKTLTIRSKSLDFWTDEKYYPNIHIMSYERPEMTFKKYFETFDVSVQEMSEILFQILFTLDCIRKKYDGFVHGNLNMLNIFMYKNTDHDCERLDYYEYKYNNKLYYAKVREYIPKIFNYECSYTDKISNNFIKTNYWGIKNDIYNLVMCANQLTKNKYSCIFDKFDFLHDTENIDIVFMIPTLDNTINYLNEVVNLQKYDIINSHIIKKFPQEDKFYDINDKICNINNLIIKIPYIQTMDLKNVEYAKYYNECYNKIANLGIYTDTVYNSIKQTLEYLQID